MNTAGNKLMRVYLAGDPFQWTMNNELLWLLKQSVWREMAYE